MVEGRASITLVPDAVEHAHHVLTNELAAEALPSQKFAANAAWFRLNVLLDSLLSAFKRVALPPELHPARPKRLCFVLSQHPRQGRAPRARDGAAPGRRGRRQLAAARRALATGPPLVRAA